MDEIKNEEMTQDRVNEEVRPEAEKKTVYVNNGAAPNDPEKKTLSIVALVLGIVGIVFDFIYLWIGLIAGIVGIIIGVKARKEENAQGMATAGFICSIIAVVLAGALLACAICAIGTVMAGMAGL